MDEGLSKAVIKVFVQLYNEKLIYKDKRLVNWDPKLLTAISDLEVVQVETKGHLWHLRYPIEGKTFNPDDHSTYIVVATTRPETMLGDTAVAVHPDDERYKALVGKNVILPLVGRRIPIIADEYSDPEKGSGAVKITPAHDFNDFEVGKRHNLRQINIFTSEAKLFVNPANGPFFAGVPPSAELDETVAMDGLDRFVARKKIVERLEAGGLVEKIEPHSNAVPHGDRSNVVIEPYLTDQWYVNAQELAKPAIAAVRDGKTKFIPQNWENTYFNWMENIQPWCISRQLWWGHQIPAWYGPFYENEKLVYETGNGGKNNLFVATSEEKARKEAEEVYKKPVEFLPSYRELTRADVIAAMKDNNRVVYLWRDEDVLDTWFSSALWPFSTLGWPEETPELKRYYPTSTLVTGFDIIFFWVARMMMMGLHFMQDATGAPEIPFHDIYIHRLVRDATGAKMSKSKGNVVDPLGVIDEFGADALRFTLMRAVAPGHDIRLGPQDVENNRNFATKLWNAARFVEFNGAARVEGFDPKSAKETLNRWIAHETAKAAAEITQAIETYNFSDAAGAAYRFVWNVYCDWYVELTKPLLTGPDGAAKDETRAMAAWALDEILKLLHPFMPFITEELWAVTALSVIPGPAEGRNPESRDVGTANTALDSGPDASRRPGMNSRKFARAHSMARTQWPRRPRRRSRNRLADRSRHRHPLGARRDEHHRRDPGGAGRRLQGNAGARRTLGRIHQAPGARVGDFFRARSARGLGAASGARRSGGAAAQGRNRSRRRTRAACQGNAESRRRHRPRRCEAQ